MTSSFDLSGTILVLGGTRSGKSAFTESLFEGCAQAAYLATAEALDDEMKDRIAVHQSRRSDGWVTMEEPVLLTRAIADTNLPLLVDCLTMWLSNLMQLEKDIASSTDELCQTLQDRTQPVVLVSNEVGGGIVPENALARRFRDEAGLLNQRVASVADSVYLVTAGLPQKLK